MRLTRGSDAIIFFIYQFVNHKVVDMCRNVWPDRRCRIEWRSVRSKPHCERAASSPSTCRGRLASLCALPVERGHFGLVLQITSAISPRDDHVFAFHAMRAAPVCGLQLASAIERQTAAGHTHAVVDHTNARDGSRLWCSHAWWRNCSDVRCRTGMYST